MSWVYEERKSWLQQLCTRIVRSGPVPRHVAFIMDGNRRFARKASIEREEGHLKGFDKLTQTLEWCLDLGITEVTVYAFSIENFKRSKDEVDGLLELARQKFMRLLQEKDKLQKHGVCVRVLGNLSLLPRDIQELIAEAVYVTRHNNRATLNVCFAYTSRDEICNSMKEISEGVLLGIIKESDITENLMDQCMYTNRSPDPELLVRTSGEVRLSDFLLWQSSFSVLSFLPVLWPEFSIWHLYGAILHYQMNHNTVQAAKANNQVDHDQLVRQSDYNCVMSEIEAEQACGKYPEGITIKERLNRYADARQQRIQNFLQHVESKRKTFFEDLIKSQPHLQKSSS